jgi:hypothetical protein
MEKSHTPNSTSRRRLFPRRQSGLRAPRSGFGIWVLGFGICFFALAAGIAYAQFGRGDFPNEPVRSAPAVFPDRNFVVCRLFYTQVRREDSGGGWRTDYPYGEINLTTRLSEMTRTPVSRPAGDRRPNHYVVRATDDALFECPFVLASDVGTVGLSADEAERLRLYLLKGGFLWVDDFWGTNAWQHWRDQIERVLPGAQYPIEDVSLDDPIFSAQFVVEHVPQITNIGFWRRYGGRETSERGSDSVDVHFRAIRDDHGRIMVVMTHNTDIADSWEREGEDPAFFYQFSPAGYAVGINVLLHAMTH